MLHGLYNTNYLITQAAAGSGAVDISVCSPPFESRALLFGSRGLPLRIALLFESKPFLIKSQPPLNLEAAPLTGPGVALLRPCLDCPATA